MDLGFRNTVSKVLLADITDGITAAVKFHPVSLQQALQNSNFMYDGRRTTCTNFQKGVYLVTVEMANSSKEINQMQV